MRFAQANLSAAYLLAAGMFGAALLLSPGAGIADETSLSAPKLDWYERLEMRINPPPDSITVEFGPWSVRLRELDPDLDAPLVEPKTPAAPAPQASPPPLITRFAGIESLAPVEVAPPEPQLIPLETFVPSFEKEIATSRFLGPVRIAPEPGKVSPIIQIADRLRAKVPRDLYANFDLFLYISKSTEGPLAQRMFVFAKNRGKARKGELTLLHDWPVSTGRETMERDNNGVLASTATPAGYYQLDSKRFYRKYTSSQWGKPMPNSMFFNWMVRGYPTGLAIHGVTDADEVAALGARASAGCVHLSPDAAEVLFNLVLRDYRGMAPRFAYNPETKTVSNNGKLSRDDAGALRMVEGYKALVIIENYGGQDLLSELDMDSSGSEG